MHTPLLLQDTISIVKIAPSIQTPFFFFLISNYTVVVELLRFLFVGVFILLSMNQNLLTYCQEVKILSVFHCSSIQVKKKLNHPITVWIGQAKFLTTLV